MKSHHATVEIASNRITRIHWFMAVIGIVIAITCCVILFNAMEKNTSDRETSSSSYNPLTNTASVIVASKLKLFK